MSDSIDDRLREQLEPEACRALPYSDRQLYLASSAISLKRIADALDGTTLGVDVSESLAGLAHAFIYGRNK